MRDTKLSAVSDLNVELDDSTMSGRNSLLPHLRWELQQVMSRVGPDDLSSTEITALLVTLRPAHSRVIAGPASRPTLRLLGVGGEESTAKLAE